MPAKKGLLDKRGPEDAPNYVKDWHDRNVWAYGYNDAVAKLLRLVPKDARGAKMKMGNRQHPVTAERLGAFMLTANPKSHVWCDANGYVRLASLEVHGMCEFAKPVVTLKSRK